MVDYPQSIENMKYQNPQNRNSFEDTDSTKVKLSKTYNQKHCLGRIQALCALQHGGKNFQKTQMSIFLRLRNRGFKK